jgi:hypothetical protein
MAVISRSPASRRLDLRLDEVTTLVALCPVDHSIGSRELNRSRERALCRSALVLLCSHMEGFFEDLIDDVIAFHEKNSTKVRNLPIALRVKQAKALVVTLSGSSSDVRKWEAIQTFRADHFYDESQACVSNMLDASLHTVGFASPGSSELESLFSSVGFTELWAEIAAWRSGYLLKGTLDALVVRRHDVAHGKLNASITPSDITQYLLDMRALADSVDISVGEWLEASHERKNPWGLLL